MSKIKPGIVLVIVALGFMLIFYRAVLFNPNAYLFSDKGDGIKNYYTYYYHIVHDTSCINFEGMNYPFGEHFLYTDCHPVLANLFKFFNDNDFFTQYAIGILNLLMMLSIFITFFLIYFILLEFDIYKWTAVLFSIGITLLAPQIFRMSGHLALSYSMAIPLSWLLILKYMKARKKAGLMLALTANNLFWLFIHSYLGIILLSFQFAFIVLCFVLDKNYRKSGLHYLNLFVTVVFPILVFYIFLFVTDNHVGRTDNPSGFFLYNAEFDDVFLPHHPPLRPILDQLFGPVIKLKWEAWSYVGLATTMVFLFLLTVSIISIFKKGKRKTLSVYFNNRTLTISLLAAFVVLLFAMAFPFKQFPQLLEIFPVLKQFRATGRFVWVFYFVATVFGAYFYQLVYDRYLNKRKQVIAYLIVLASGVFMVVEGVPYHIETSNSITRSSNQFNTQLLGKTYQEAINCINPEKFQAILPLPFYYQGSETFARPRHDETMRASMILSAHTGLPMFSANLTRTSIPESKKIVQLVSPSFYEKTIQHDLTSKKPVLIITTNDPITHYEQKILWKSKQIFKSENIKLYQLTFDDLFKSDADAYLKEFEAQKDSLFEDDIFLVSDSSSFLYFESYETKQSDIVFRGTGAFNSAKKGKNILAELSPGTFESGKTYALSCWMYNGFKDALNLHFQLRVEEFDESANSWENTICFPEQSEVISGNWSLVEMEFKVKNPDSYVYIVSKGKLNSKSPFVADELLIREQHLDVYRMDTVKKTLFYNNHDIKF